MWGAIIGAGVNLASGLIGYSQQQKELGRQKELAEKRKAEADAAAEKARNAPKYTVSKGFREAAMLQKQDRAGDLAQQQIDRTTSERLGALTGSGAKAALGGVGATQRDAADLSQQAQVASQTRQLAGVKDLAREQQLVDDANVSGEKDLLAFEFGRALSRGDTQEALADSLTNEQNLAKMGMTQDLVGAVGGGVNLLSGMLETAEKGMKVKETPGEFSHRTNPIDLVRNGTKIGEATGGELIFNPEQSGKLETLATEGSTELHKYLRSLFKKFNKKS